MAMSSRPGASSCRARARTCCTTSASRKPTLGSRQHIQFMKAIYPNPQDLRMAAREGNFREPTSGHAPGYLQANLMIVPQKYAFDFLLFCQRNPKPCPLIEVLEPGSVSPKCARGAD